MSICVTQALLTWTPVSVCLLGIHAVPHYLLDLGFGGAAASPLSGYQIQHLPDVLDLSLYASISSQ